MVRQRLLGPVRLTLVAALLGMLLVTTAGVVSARGPSITASPGSAIPVGGNTFYISFGNAALDLDVDCGGPASQCSVWVARNNAAKATEALFTNVTGVRTLIPVGFINDGCFNFRLYDSAHGPLLGQLNVGHGLPTTGLPFTVCNADGTANAQVLISGAGTEIHQDNQSGIATTGPYHVSGAFLWDSGFTGGVEDSQIWITQSERAFVPVGNPGSGPGIPFTDCNTVPFPNSTEVLYAQNVSGNQSGHIIVGGGPYCLTLYQGTAHTTKIAGPVSISFGPYLQYAGGTPEVGLDSAQGTVYFNSGNAATNALVCVWGPSIAGSDILHQVPFAYNSQGWNPGGTVASFQTAGKGVIEYQLHVGVGGFDASGNPTAASCATGTVPTLMGTLPPSPPSPVTKFGVDT